VAVAAHNESRFIAQTIQSINDQLLSGGFSFEIAIVANGCTDNTAEVAQSTIEELEPRNEVKFTVHELSEASKPGAINHALQMFDTDLFIYTDGDCTFSANAFDSVASILQARRSVATGPTPKLVIPPDIRGSYIGNLHRAWQLYESASGMVRTPIGRMLGFRPVDLGRPIPSNIIAEDRFITLSLTQRFGYEATSIAGDSKVYGIAPRSVDDLITQMARYAAGAEQLRQSYPALYNIGRVAAEEKRNQMISKSEATGIVREQLQYEGIDPSSIDDHHALFSLSRLLGRKMLSEIERNGTWEPIDSTKWL